MNFLRGFRGSNPQIFPQKRPEIAASSDGLGTRLHQLANSEGRKWHKLAMEKAPFNGAFSCICNLMSGLSEQQGRRAWLLLALSVFLRRPQAVREEPERRT